MAQDFSSHNRSECPSLRGNQAYNSSVVPLNIDIERKSSFLHREMGEQPMSLASGVQSSKASDASQKANIIVIDENNLTRSCLMRCLAEIGADFVTRGYCDVDEWRQAPVSQPTAIVLMCATGQRSTEIAIRRDLETVTQTASAAHAIIVSDFEDHTEIVTALERGAKGYISMNSSLEVAIAAIRLVKAGGVFVPTGGLASRRPDAPPVAASEAVGKDRFTDRQLEVLQRLRKGESNKIIAYKLNMAECTVKVHVRNIMRRINARNRTEIAFLTNELF